MIIRIVILSFISGLVLACAPAHNTYGGSEPGGGDQTLGEPKTLGFEAVTMVFSRNRCLECHSNAGGNRDGINLETYANTKSFAEDVLSEMASGEMPRSGPRVSDADVAIIRAWVEIGAPETSTIALPGEPVVVVPPPPPITFAEVNQKIFTPMCVRCHATFNDHAVVTARLNGIVSAIGTNRMPLGGPPVPDDLKTLLADWVAQGAKLE